MPMDSAGKGDEMIKNFRVMLPAWRELVMLVMCLCVLRAQITLSTIRGTAIDPTGAVVVNARITVASMETGAKRETLTDANGNFEIPDLPRGKYRLTAQAAGFKTFAAEDILLDSSQIRRINPAFELGTVGTEVSVTAGAAVISTDTAKLQSFVNVAKHFDNPWVGAEAVLDHSLYITTLPLVQQAGGVWGTQVAGQPGSQVQMGQDGHTNDGAVNQLNDILDTQEIQVTPVNNSAEFPRVGYMNLVTKGGTNEFHGRVTYFHQNSALGARQFFEGSEKFRTLIHTSSIGVSGPIIKDKTFFYVAWNQLNEPGEQFWLRTVPTDRMRQGDFSELLTLSRPVVLRDPLSGNPFPNNVIPRDRFNGVANKILDKYLPGPNRSGPGALSNNYSFIHPFPYDYVLRRDTTQRIDHQLTTNNRIMGRIIENLDNYASAGSFPLLGRPRQRWNVHVVIEDTHVFSPSFVNTFRLGLYQEKVEDGLSLYGQTPIRGDDAVKELGIQGVNPQGLSAAGFPRMNITGYPAIQVSPGGEPTLNDFNWGYADTATWSKGRHVIKFGGEFKPKNRFTNSVPTGSYGDFAFNGMFTGYGFADFVLGYPSTSSRLDPITSRWRDDSELGLFLTDDFKVNNRLTLNIGIRWDRFGAPKFRDGLMWNWDINTGNVVIPPGTEDKVRPLYPKSITLATGQVAQDPDNANFAPRLGVAWRPLGENTVIRAGYGLYTEYLGRYGRLNTGGPFEISENYVNEIVDGKPLLSFPNPFPASLERARIPSQSFTGYPVDTQNGRIHQFNVTVERQVRDIGFRLSYAGSRSRDMNYSIAINKPEPSLIPFTASRRPWPQFSGGSYYRNNGAANFNALTLQGQRKLGNVTFDAHWTWASNYNNMLNLSDPYAPLGFGRDQYTTRHRAVVNTVWEIPVGKGRRYLPDIPAAANHVLGGWQLYWIAYFESGWFFSPSFSGSDPSNTNTFGGLPDRICNGNLPAGERSIHRWFDASCFVAPPAGSGRFGNSGPNILEGPGYHMHHISLAKSFNLTERFRFTLTAAAANAFNHPNFARPSANISSPGSVGVVSGLRAGAPARSMEIRGRIDF
jgi:hypothetical protein